MEYFRLLAALVTVVFRDLAYSQGPSSVASHVFDGMLFVTCAGTPRRRGWGSGVACALLDVICMLNCFRALTWTLFLAPRLIIGSVYKQLNEKMKVRLRSLGWIEIESVVVRSLVIECGIREGTLFIGGGGGGGWGFRGEGHQWNFGLMGEGFKSLKVRGGSCF